MKKTIIELVVLMSSMFFAQTADTYLELLRSDVITHKKAVIAEAMNLNELQKNFGLFIENLNSKGLNLLM